MNYANTNACLCIGTKSKGSSLGQFGYLIYKWCIFMSTSSLSCHGIRGTQK